MPELPEIETVRQNLLAIAINKTITKVEVRYDKILKNISKEDFSRLLVNQVIKDIKRLGKYLIIELSDYYLISHLRMEGKYIFDRDAEFSKHEHIVFFFDDNKLRYHDTRKFGTMHLYPKDIDIYQELPLRNVGYEPFDERLTIAYLESKFKNSKRPIKSTLLDQKIIAGLGNIYVDEVLYMCRLHPQTATGKLSLEDIKNIKEKAIIVLNKAIALGGTTIRTFTSGNHISGRFQNELLIHTKNVCPNCMTEIKKIFVGGRGTYHCHICQVKK